MHRIAICFMLAATLFVASFSAGLIGGAARNAGELFDNIAQGKESE